MTKEEFLQRLREKTHVDFGESRVDGDSTVISDAIADDLSKILPSNTEIKYAIQLSELGDGAAGSLMWLLSLPGQLVKMELRFIKKSEEKKILEIACRLYPTTRLESMEILVQRQEGYKSGGDLTTYPKTATANLVFEGGEHINIESGQTLKPQAVREFVNSLLTQ